MKILFFTGVPVDDGATMFRSGALAQNLQKQGHRIVFTSVDRKFEAVRQIRAGNLKIRFIGQAHYCASEKLSVRKKLGWGRVILENLKTGRRLAGIIVREKPDRVLVVAAMPVSWLAGLVARILGCWTTIDIEDYALGQMAAAGYSPLSIKFYRLAEQLSLRFFNQIAVCSQYLQRQYPGSRVIPNFVDCDFWGDKKKIGEGKNLFFVGQIGLYHGQPEILAGLANFLHQEKDLKLFFVGKGERLQNLKQKVKDLRLESRVIFTGQITQAEIRHLYLPGDIGILPLWSKPVHQARHPLKLIEYLAAGLVVITNRVGEAARIIHDHQNGLFYPEGDYACLVKKMRLVMADRIVRQTISQNARLTAKEFDVQPVMAQWSKFLSL